VLEVDAPDVEVLTVRVLEVVMEEEVLDGDGGRDEVFGVDTPDVDFPWSGLAMATGMYVTPSAQPARAAASAKRGCAKRGVDRLMWLAMFKLASISLPWPFAPVRVRAPARAPGRSRTHHPFPKARRS
jgi:hypothetical protein